MSTSRTASIAHRLFACVAVISLIASGLRPATARAAPTRAATTRTATRTAPLSPPPLVSAAPAEIVEQRTANSTTVRLGDGRYATTIAAESIHYRDGRGRWQPIDPAFQRRDESFVVEHNSVRSRAGLTRAWLSAAVNETALLWQSDRLGVADGDRFASLAVALPAAPQPAQRREADRVLHYLGAWSDHNLIEEIVSAPDSIEHRLIISHRLRLSSSTASPHLDLQAQLTLLPGANLWGDGQPIGPAGTTAKRLEVRDGRDQIALIFDPVIAYEQAAPWRAVEGEYVVTPTGETGEWTIRVRTPLAWWLDRTRAYPVVLDPTMRVLRSTGYGEGLAWVRSTGNQAYTPGGIRLGAHLPDWNTQSRGYVQFNSLPAALINAPISVTAAYLDVQPTLPAEAMPLYKNSPVDWEYKVIQRETELRYVGACPLDAACNNLSLHDNRINNTAQFNWTTSPTGTLIDTQPLVAGPAAGGGQPVVTTFDVTTQIRAWYQQHYAQTGNRPAPLFRLSMVDTCPQPGPYAFGFVNVGQLDTSYQYVPKCVWFDLPPGSVRLRIEYNVLPLSLGQNPLNAPGVPSFLADVFEDTGHEYALTPSGGAARWRAIAVRGNHGFTAGAPTRTALTVWHDAPGGPQALANAAGQGADRTAYVLLDDHSPGGIGSISTQLRAEVKPSNENDYPSDLQRNYRLDYQSAAPINVTYGITASSTGPFRSDRLIQLSEFNLQAGDNVLVRVTAPITFEAALAAPTNSATVAGGALGNTDPAISANFEPSNYVTRSLSIGSAPTGGQWAVALINHGRPIACTPGTVNDEGRCSPDGVWEYIVRIYILACPAGSIPTVKYACQPLRLPDDNTPPPAPRTMPLEGGGNLIIYSEGGFVDTTATRWCTTNEGSGAPIIGPVQNNRWVFVAQGRVCRNDGAFFVTPDSAIGLAVPVQNFNPNDKRGQYPPGFIYGDTGLSPVPVGFPDGTFALGSNGELNPTVTTRKNLLPFKLYWDDQTTPAFDRLHTGDMIYRGQDVIDGRVTVEAEAAPYDVQWTVPWQLYPNTAGSSPSYSFVAFPVTQMPDLPMPLNVASAQLRVAENSGMPDGLIRILDAQLTAGGPVAYQFRATGGTLTLDAQLGGATTPAQVVIQPPGLPRRPANESSCKDAGGATSCLDLRPPDYSWDNGAAEKQVKPWLLPDVHIEDTVQTAIFSRVGQLNIFSGDHPAQRSSAANLAQTFSFDTWEVTASVSQASCVSGGPLKTVIEGAGYIALPSIGDDGSSAPPWIKVNFRLCENQLQQAQLAFAVPPPGIPVGSSGFGVDVIGGVITIDPATSDTEVNLNVSFQTLDNTTVTDGEGVVTLNTAGLFSLQAQGKILGVINADSLLLQVAWNPLDVLFDGTVSYKSLLSGRLYLHGWIGRGWQGKYAWLPDDDAFHFTGSIEATLKIPKGELINKKYFKLPPFSFSLSAEVSFGEFCSNSNCTAYAWGMSAAVKVFGYKVGVYVDKGGPDLFLGSSSHKLIDQFGGARRAEAAAPQSPAALPVFMPGYAQQYLLPEYDSIANTWSIDTPASAGCTGATPLVCSFMVSAGTGRALFAVSWENGDLDVELVKPDMTVITPANALANGVEISTTVDPLLKIVTFAATPTAGDTIMSGEWRVRIGNIGAGLLPGISNNYSLMFAADPPAPALNWITPVMSGTQPINGVINLQWTATRGGQPIEPGVFMELFYSPIADKPITPTLMAGLMITTGLRANLGQFAWDTRGLATGEYAVGARLDDHAKSNGHVVVWAPGTIVISDTTPPPIPTLLGTLAVINGLNVYWQRDDVTPDLAGYLVEYQIPDWSLSGLNRVRRVIPSAKTASPLAEHVRLGGLLPLFTTIVCVRAYDASGNVSGCNPIGVQLPEGPEPRLGPPPDIQSIDVNGSGSITVNWSPGTGNITGYLLGYAPARCRRADAVGVAAEGRSPIVYSGRTLSYTFSALTIGQFYQITIQSYAATGEVSEGLATGAMVIDPTDGNADGISDQWAALYELTPDDPDPDRDGLSNVDEYQQGSDPLNADSDGDGVYDGAEMEAGRDVCGPDEAAPNPAPVLAAVGQSTVTFQGAPNANPPAPAALQLINFGGGVLDWSAQASAPWITLNQTRGMGDASLLIGADADGLTPGAYSGIVTIVGGAARTAFAPVVQADETITIAVKLNVLPIKQLELWLPLARR